MACELHGISGYECVAVGWVETAGTWRDATSSTGCRGVMQVDPRYTSTPRWLLATTSGNAWAGAKAIAYWQKRKGARWPRHYACGNVAKVQECLDYEAAVLATMRRLGWAPRNS